MFFGAESNAAYGISDLGQAIFDRLVGEGVTESRAEDITKIDNGFFTNFVDYTGFVAEYDFSTLIVQTDTNLISTDTVDINLSNSLTLSEDGAVVFLGGNGTTSISSISSFVDGTQKTDFIFGSEGFDIINGLAGDDILFGGAGNDIIVGGFGEDIISGGAGDDVLSGADSTAFLGGKFETDTFIFGIGDGNDTITDFYANSSFNDFIEFDLGDRYDTFAEVYAAASKDGSDVLFEFDVDGNGTVDATLRLEDVKLQHLDAGDFLFA